MIMTAPARTVRLLTLAAAVVASMTIAHAAEVTAHVTGPEEGHLGAYKGHEGHPRRTWTATMRTGTTRFVITHWVDVHPSHAPKVLPLEGMIGLTGPTHANWYANGFLNIHLPGGEMVGTAPIDGIRVSETGSRGAVELQWRRPEGVWRVKFIALPDDDRLFCSVRHWPGEEPAGAWYVRLDCYPGRQEHGGRRVVTTATRVLENGAETQIAASDEWWMALSDRVWDPADGLGEGGATLIYAPDDVSEATVEVTDYPVHVLLTPAGERVRMVFRESFQQVPNAQLVSELRVSAQQRLAALREMRFVHRGVFSDEWRERRREIAQLLQRLGQPEERAARAAELATTIERLTAKLRAVPGEAEPDDEADLCEALAAQRDLLWELRWDELLRP